MSDDLLGSFFSDIAAVEEDVVPSAKKARTSVQGADAATIGGTIAGAPTHTVTVMAVTALAPPALQAAATSTVFSAAPSAAPVSSNFDHYSSSSYSSSSSSSAAPPSSSSSSSQDKAKVGGADLMSFLMSKVKPQVNSSGHAPAWAPTPDPRGMGGADTFTGAGGAGTGTAGMEGVKTSDRDKVFVRKAAGETWVDDSLRDWPENDFRLFIGDLSKDVKEKALEEAFQHYKVVMVNACVELTARCRKSFGDNAQFWRTVLVPKHTHTHTRNTLTHSHTHSHTHTHTHTHTPPLFPINTDVHHVSHSHEQVWGQGRAHLQGIRICLLPGPDGRRQSDARKAGQVPGAPPHEDFAGRLDEAGRQGNQEEGP